MSGLPDRFTPVPQGLFEETYGSSYICAIITVFLYGISVLQGYMYYLKYPRDSPSVKTLVQLHIRRFLHPELTASSLKVCTLLIMGTVHTILSFQLHKSRATDTRRMVGLYIIHIRGGFLRRSFGYTTINLKLDYLVKAVMCFIIQVFFANMIFHLTKGAWRALLAATFVVLSLAQLAFAIFFCQQEFKLWELGKLVTIVHITMVPMLAFRIITDVFICVSLCYTLWDSRTEVQRTSKLIHTLIVYAINRFVLTTVVVIVQMIVLITKPQSIGAMVIEFVTVHLYFNSLLATLNSRNHLRHHLDNGHVITDSDLPTGRGKASAVRFAGNYSRSTIPGQQSFTQPATTTMTMTTTAEDNHDGVKREISIPRETETFIMSDLSNSLQKPGELV
ncbi:hypothetical protein D9758_005183 [Tetrapyrgos nigripes]|uniref:DUF6534 domain-containing protein n=1 Tax=Tetrapyrgos nigripes TaxID=182062 RepID=A0A8H5LWW7_9AGAR|nr:hypothetical protein D9758_005183 [Tetrapyrgos nigripes]